MDYWNEPSPSYSLQLSLVSLPLLNLQQGPFPPEHLPYMPIISNLQCLHLSYSPLFDCVGVNRQLDNHEEKLRVETIALRPGSSTH